MGDNWYCLIFGEELGPMSWDDLVAMAAHGTLGKREQVKQGADAQWRAAEVVPGLFSSNTLEATPESSNELDFEMNESVPPAADDDTDFAIDPPVASLTRVEAPADADFDLAASAEPAPAEEASKKTDLDAGAPPPRAAVMPVAPNARDFGVRAPAKSSSPHAAAARPHPEQRNIETGKRPSKTAYTKKPNEKSSGLRPPSKRVLILILGAVGGLASAYLVYIGIVALAATRKPNYDEILAGYDQLFQQAQAAKDDSSVLGNPQATMEFLATLKTLRARLKNTDPESADAQLAEAGTLLAQLFASAGSPDSETAQERKVAETAYLAKVSAVRNKLGE